MPLEIPDIKSTDSDGYRPEGIKAAFGQRVRELRATRGLSQEALACDLDRSYIGGIERCERNVRLIIIQKIAVALGVPMREMF